MQRTYPSQKFRAATARIPGSRGILRTASQAVELPFSKFAPQAAFGALLQVLHDTAARPASNSPSR